MNRSPDSLAGVYAPPKPSQGVKERTLAAAKASMGRAETPDIWTRIWGNGAARVAWAVSLGCLLFGHLAMNDHVNGKPAVSAMPLSAVVDVDEELTEIVALPRLTARLPGFGVAPPRSSSTTNERVVSEETS